VVTRRIAMAAIAGRWKEHEAAQVAARLGVGVAARNPGSGIY
jgi:hypothetical protein